MRKIVKGDEKVRKKGLEGQGREKIRGINAAGWKRER